MSRTVEERRRRPHDRRDQILAAARRRFTHTDFDRVSMADIAGDAGITASALYRHFSGKHQLLVCLLIQVVDELKSAVSGLDDLDTILRVSAEQVIRRREFGALWDRQRYQIDPADRKAVEKQLQHVVDRTSRAVLLERPDLTGSAGLRARAAHAVLLSTSHHRTTLPFDQFVGVLAIAARAAALVEFPDDAMIVDDLASSASPPPDSRREALVAAATSLFGARTYPAASLGEIGASAGISGPAIYKHFSRKTDLLAAVLKRGEEFLWANLERALSDGADPFEQLIHAFEGYVEISAREPEMIAVIRRTLDHLPPSGRDSHRQRQAQYVSELVGLLRNAREELSPERARVLVHAALALPNTLSQESWLAGPGYRGSTLAMLRAVLAS